MQFGFLTLLALGCLFPILVAEPLVFKDCGCQKGKLLNVDVSLCPTQPCPLVKGSTYSINVTFTSDEDSVSSKAYVYGVIKQIPIPFGIPEPDGCKSGVECPIKNGQTYTYITKMPIKTEYPSIRLIVRWKLKDDNSNNLFCWDIPVEITNG
ncbi:NPC intracellular cholesterol transporter 2-like [Bombina bombina]|uniref:NPC intracellular cholesterol transporter 2-like n=1 Tax=Bombina bombina TaxID=8345 RepID=UPI00235AEAA6|nr:NPC intracellular cholesterol transporter 2-like [Bombina bombina]